MKKAAYSILALLFAGLISSLPAATQAIERGGHCADFDNGNTTMFGDDLPTYHSVETRTIARGAKLTIHAAKNGGVSVQGYDGNDIEVTACKLVGAENESEAAARRSQIRINVKGGHVSAEVPE